MQLAGGTRRFFSCFLLLTGSHISEVLQENEALKKQVELLLLQSEQEKEALKADAAQAKQQLSRYSRSFCSFASVCFLLVSKWFYLHLLFRKCYT